jgi:hypothetical protein
VQSDVGGNLPAFEVGQQVKVLFEPGSPDDATIDSIGQLWSFSILFLAIGSAAFACGLAGQKLLARRTKQSMGAGLRSDFATIRGAIRCAGFN